MMSRSDCCRQVSGRMTSPIPQGTIATSCRPTPSRTPYALAAGTGIVEPEALGPYFARHFLEGNPRLDEVRVDLTARQWARLRWTARRTMATRSWAGARPALGHGDGQRTGITLSAGVVDLLILKTSRSAFTGFMRDAFTTLPETNDRRSPPLTGTWQVRDPGSRIRPQWYRCARPCSRPLPRTRARPSSTRYAMGEAVIAATPDVQSIHLAMPNKHHAGGSVALWPGES